MKTRRRKKAEPATASIRYRSVLARGECSVCGHWAILTHGLCSDCKPVTGQGQVEANG